MRNLLDGLRARLLGETPLERYQPVVRRIQQQSAAYQQLSDRELQAIAGQIREQARNGTALAELVVSAFALTGTASARVLDMKPFDVQLMGALSLDEGFIAEMQTGEGKTLAATFPVFLHALMGRGVHVMTVNDYLARRDAEWMGAVYRFLGLSAAHIEQGMSLDDRRRAYAADITYATANEIGFDYLRDHLRSRPEELVQRAFHFALIDEADSILIDEARIPLVIAGGREDAQPLVYRIAAVVRRLNRGHDYTLDDNARNVQLTNAGAHRVEQILRGGNLYDPQNLSTLTLVNCALHAQVLLHRDVDYVVKQGRIEHVDEFKGRIAHDRQWPDGIQAALEAKENLDLRGGGRVLSSITLQNLIALYPRVCGMTGTAETQAAELQQIYGLKVVVIPTNRPMIREDLPDVVFTHKGVKEDAVVSEIERAHSLGRPVLVGTASVEESERLGRRLEAAAVPHQVLNARNDEMEAAIIAQAGALGAVTISTNMAGRGTDIVLGGNPPQRRDDVVELGGLYVIGTNRHEARRIDNQLRGRSGRQGDPGTSRFFVSAEDDLIVRYGIQELLPEQYRGLRSDKPVSDPAVAAEIARAQRIIEGQNLEIRKMLWRYESILETQRKIVHERRRAVMTGEFDSILEESPSENYAAMVERHGAAAVREAERLITLAKIDEGWSDYLVATTEVRDGIHWQTFAGKDPLHVFRTTAVQMFDEMLDRIERETIEAFEQVRFSADGIDLSAAGLLEPGATWTYLSTDQLYGPLSERWAKGLKKMVIQALKR